MEICTGCGEENGFKFVSGVYDAVEKSLSRRQRVIVAFLERLL